MLIAVVNQVTGAHRPIDAHVAAYCTAQYKQFRYNFCPAWALATPAVVPYATPLAVPVGAQLILLRNKSDQAGALAYHDETPAGAKVSIVFIETLLAAGLSWTSGASHEALEMRGDESCNRYADNGNGDYYALEVADPVESDSYTIDAVDVSDFVFPAWFDPQAPKNTRTRQMATHSRPNLAPFELAPGGYAIRNGQAIFADADAERRKALKGGGGHSALRST